MTNANPTARRRNLVIQELPGEVLVYDLDTHKAMCLNESAALVWRTCDGNASVADIVRHFESSGRGKVTEDFVWLAIDQLNESGLLENDIAPRFQGQSRRQVLKNIGLATVVALPLIASIVAPSNALGNVNCSCSTPVQCQMQTTCPSTVNCSANGICAP